MEEKSDNSKLFQTDGVNDELVRKLKEGEPIFQLNLSEDYKVAKRVREQLRLEDEA